jgi:outer membrane protein assembly factor BamB
MTDLTLDAGLYSGLNRHYIYFGSSDGYLRCRRSDPVGTTPDNWIDFPANSPIRSTPYLNTNGEVSDWAIFFGADNGKFYKLDATSGTLRWEYQADGPIRCNAVIPYNQSGSVYFGSDDGFVYKVSVLDGSMRQGYPVRVSAGVKRLILDYEDYDSLGIMRLYVGTADGRIIVLRID